MVSADEYDKFSQYQKTLRSPSQPITAIADSGNPSQCLLSSSSKWVIDSGATDHMTGSYDEEDLVEDMSQEDYTYWILRCLNPLHVPVPSVCSIFTVDWIIHHFRYLNSYILSFLVYLL
ncbi:uncharacterized protein LOC125371152 [Ricinus communis]|uniref:uncharacterized protein LOC125371152 n=1 Tax=Ricinus communis TaxID=3988 RepID=UPI00201A6BBF|nr:uncharacterized protein LOC125371152 [Ricinus communis]